VRLLLLGGPKFLGRAVADAALARSHELTFFNRGRTSPELYPDVEKLRGDRTEDLSALREREWDAVIDTSGYVPHVVRSSAEALAGADVYCFVSTISVYADFAKPVGEESPLEPLGELPADELAPDFANYGALKALCEEAVREAFGERALVVRPGLIVGPHDPTGRFTYWPHRVARGGDVLAPGPPERQIQFIDVRDLAAWLLDAAESRVTGTFNATQPGRPWQELLETAREVAGSGAKLVWVDDDFLAEHDVGEWMELPMWIRDPEWVGMHMADVTRALEAGLTFRPLPETVRETLELAEPTDEAGLAREREAELLQAWAARR
jgi:2'-hydroxyisoflavone reductase